MEELHLAISIRRFQRAMLHKGILWPASTSHGDYQQSTLDEIELMMRDGFDVPPHLRAVVLAAAEQRARHMDGCKRRAARDREKREAAIVGTRT